MQERTVSAMLAELRALPGWDDTVVVFVSDHGEEFREHGGMYHLTSLFDEQVRIPGWVLAGPRALDASQRAAVTPSPRSDVSADRARAVKAPGSARSPAPVSGGSTATPGR